MDRAILVLGATGLFGGHLARTLIARGHCVLIAARSEARLNAFSQKYGGTVVVLDRDAEDIEARLSAIAPAVVIDAAGPFQSYGEDPYRFAKAVLSAGAHYVDLADAPGFVAGIDALDMLAQDKGLSVLSGASSTPALSAAVVETLSEGLDQIDTIETAILPGNRTERGLSVIQAILSQAGQPFRLWRGGRWDNAIGWSKTRRMALRVKGHDFTRRAALHEAPETLLFPQHFKARTVVFRAGLELGILHHGLSLATWLVRLGILKSLLPFSNLTFRVSSWVKRLGSDKGGMCVRVVGQRGVTWESRDWHLVAPDGIGPRIPSIPAALLAEKLLQHEIAPGARPALNVLRLSELEEIMDDFGIVTERREQLISPLFQQVMGDGFHTLPGPVQALHNVQGVVRFKGRAEVTGASSILGKLAAKIAGFPSSLSDVDVSVEIDANEDREVWCRNFDGHKFHSVLTKKGAYAVERFGPFRFTLGLANIDNKLVYPVLRGSFLGIPLPSFLTPKSTSYEDVDDQGRFLFDVKIELPLAGLVAHYRGWLMPDDGEEA